MKIPFVPKPRPTGKFAAGASRVDFTPPPGYPLGGSGFTAAFGRGYWTRLYARAFFFRDRSGQSLALVSCDLFMIPGGLQAEVVRQLNLPPYKDRRLGLARRNVVLAATHTHEGPGNFLTSKVFNSYGSPLAGFDRALFDWLASRIVKSVAEAAVDADSSVDEPKISLRQGWLQHILRNRAPVPFMLNWDRDAILAEGPPGHCAKDDPYPVPCPRYRAVDESLTAIEINRGGVVAAELVFFAAHPEVMTYETGLYQSDFVGLAMGRLERQKAGPRVAGFFNGADADISVDWNPSRRNRIEAAEFATKLVDDVNQLLVTEVLDPALCIEVGRFEAVVNPIGGKDPVTLCANTADRCLAKTPQFGTATPGGGEDGRTVFFDLGWKPNVRTEAGLLQIPGQGPKLPTYDSRMIPEIKLTRCIAPPCYFPERLVVSMARLGPVSLAALPVELSRTMWRRTRLSLQKAGLDVVLPIGLANEYLGYVPAPEEYAAQGYEGASDIFGPYSGEVYQALLLNLVGKLGPPIPSGGQSRESPAYYPGTKQSFGPESLGNSHASPDEGLESLIVDNQELPTRSWPWFEWDEEGIGDWEAAGRLVELLDSPSKSPVDEDSTGNLLTVFMNPAFDGLIVPTPRPLGPLRVHRVSIGGVLLDVEIPRSGRVESSKRKSVTRRWAAIWLQPGGDPAREFYFRVALNDNPDPVQRTKICSKIFSLSSLSGNQPPRKVDAAARCP